MCVLAEGEGRRRDKEIPEVSRCLDAGICEVLSVVLPGHHAQSPSLNHSIKGATWPHTISRRAGWGLHPGMSPSLGHGAANTAVAKRFLVEPSGYRYEMAGKLRTQESRMMVHVDIFFRFMCNAFTNQKEISGHLSKSRFFSCFNVKKGFCRAVSLRMLSRPLHEGHWLYEHLKSYH